MKKPGVAADTLAIEWKQGLSPVKSLVITTLLAAIVLGLTYYHPLPSAARPSELSRQAVQDFLQRPGNGPISADWAQLFDGQPVCWQGTVYRVVPSATDETTDILLKVLPNSYLYDTVVTLPNNHPALRYARPGETLRLEGVISGAVDTMMLKEVHVEARRY